MLSLVATLSLASLVAGHACPWHPSMWGFNYTTAGNKPMDPLQELTFDKWWFHDHLDFPPHKEDFLEFPAGGKTTVEITCDKGASTYWPQNIGGEIPNSGNEVCPGQPMAEYHTEGFDDLKGCAFAIAYVPPSQVNTIKPADFTIFSVQHTCVWQRQTEFEVPADMPACPPGGCTCAWFWIHSQNSGSEQIYMNGYQCQITGAKADAPALAMPQVARRCGVDDQTKKLVGSDANCTHGAKQPLYWLQKEGNNMFEGNHAPPFYNDLYNFKNGAQNDIFVNSELPKMDWQGAPVSGQLKAVRGEFGNKATAGAGGAGVGNVGADPAQSSSSTPASSSAAAHASASSAHPSASAPPVVGGVSGPGPASSAPAHEHAASSSAVMSSSAAMSSSSAAAVASSSAVVIPSAASSASSAPSSSVAAASGAAQPAPSAPVDGGDDDDCDDDDSDETDSPSATSSSLATSAPASEPTPSSAPAPADDGSDDGEDCDDDDEGSDATPAGSDSGADGSAPTQPASTDAGSDSGPSDTGSQGQGQSQGSGQGQEGSSSHSHKHGEGCGCDQCQAAVSTTVKTVYVTVTQGAATAATTDAIPTSSSVVDGVSSSDSAIPSSVVESAAPSPSASASASIISESTVTSTISPAEASEIASSASAAAVSDVSASSSADAVYSYSYSNYAGKPKPTPVSNIASSPDSGSDSGLASSVSSGPEACVSSSSSSLTGGAYGKMRKRRSASLTVEERMAAGVPRSVIEREQLEIELAKREEEKHEAVSKHRRMHRRSFFY